MNEERKNKIFWAVFILLIFFVVANTYVRIFLQKDYMLLMEVPCDPDLESCFVHTPADLCEDSVDQNCLQNTESEYYKIIHKKAATVPNYCEQNSESLCAELLCSDSDPEEDCYYELNI